MWWRPVAALAAVLVSMPVWEELSVVEIGLTLAVPAGWIWFLKPRAAAAMTGCVAVFAGVTVWLATWGAPPTYDDFFRWYLFVAWAIGLTGIWRASGVGARVGLVVAACATIVVVPDVREVPMPGRGAMIPEPPGVFVVAESAECDGPTSCERVFEVVATDNAGREELKQRLTKHLQRRGWAINSQHVDEACEQLGWVFNPYRGCVSISYNHVTARFDIRHSTFNPREPRIVYTGPRHPHVPGHPSSVPSSTEGSEVVTLG